MREAITFREARRDDLEAVVAMLADDRLGAGRDDASLPLDRRYGEAFEAIFANDACLLIVGEQDDAIVASTQIFILPHLSHLGATRGQVENVRVSSHLRGQGVGKRLMEHAITLCRERGCRMVQLTTNLARDDTERFYKRLGFETTHRGMKLKLD